MNVNSVIDNLVSNLIWLVIVVICTAIYSFRNELSNAQYVILAINFCLLIILLHHKKRFQDTTGIKKIDPSMKKGISPLKSLEKCQDNIKFLGIAANKLIEEEAFEEAIQRCNRPDQPILFLLSHPDNPILKHMAKRAKKDEDQFRNMIIAALKKLKDLKENKGFNLLVRLYKSDSDSGPPSFRLFFIDNKSVLVSYYFMGEGDGLQMPQLHIFKPKNKRDVENFYYAFNHYFNSLWDMSEEYDFNQLNVDE